MSDAPERPVAYGLNRWQETLATYAPGGSRKEQNEDAAGPTSPAAAIPMSPAPPLKADATAEAAELPELPVDAWASILYQVANSRCEEGGHYIVSFNPRPLPSNLPFPWILRPFYLPCP